MTIDGWRTRIRSKVTVMNKRLILCNPTAKHTWLCSSAVSRCWPCSCFGNWSTTSVDCNGRCVWIWDSSPACDLIMSTSSYSPMTVQGGRRLRRPRPHYGVLEGSRGLALLIPNIGNGWSRHQAPAALSPGKKPGVDLAGSIEGPEPVLMPWSRHEFLCSDRNGI